VAHALQSQVCCGEAQVDPQFYAFRWITLLLTQEFSCPDVTRLWDTMLSDPAGRTDSLLRLCMAMLLNLRQELLQVRWMIRFCCPYQVSQHDTETGAAPDPVLHILCSSARDAAPYHLFWSCCRAGLQKT